MAPRDIFLLLFISIVGPFPSTNGLLRSYMSLILALHKHYRTSTVCFITSDKYQPLEHFTMTHTMSRELSRQNVLSLAINFDDIEHHANKSYYKRATRSFIIVLLRTVEDVEDFHKNTRKVDISYPIWLMIFTDDLDPKICEYCEKPVGNILGLRFNTEMVVSCCKDRTLREWWALSDDKTEMTPYGSWTADNGFEVSVGDVFYERRRDINGTGLRIALITNSRSHSDEVEPIDGFLSAVLMELKRAMKFKVTETIEGENFGNWDPVTRSWSGAVKEIAKGNADLGVGTFAMTNQRVRVVDFTVPLLLSRTVLYFKESDGSGIQWFVYLKAFRSQIWMAILLLVITTTILVTLIKMKNCSNALVHIFFEHYLCVWGIFCQQGLAEFPVRTSLRIAYFSIFILASVVSAAYSAAFISYLTVSTGGVPFSSIEEYANDGSYGLIVTKGDSAWDFVNSSPDPVIKKMKGLLRPTSLLPKTVEKALKEVCRGKVGFLMSEAIVATTKIVLPCKIVSVETGRVHSLGMIMPPQSQFTGVVNYHLQRFRENGLMSHLRNKYFTKPRSPETQKVVTIWGVAPILSILAGGFTIAIIVLSWEMLCHKFNKLVKHRSTKSI